MATILVTGASSGIGAACVRRLDDAGHEVVACVRSDDAAERLGQECSARLTPVILDVTDPASIAVAAQEVGRRVGDRGLDGLVNNAGIAVGGPVEFLPLDEWRHQLEVNVVGQVAVVQEFAERVRAARGRIVFVGSLAGRVSTPFGGPYGASKHAIAAVAQSLREELRPWGVKVALVEPGAVATPIWDKGVGSVDVLYERLGERAMSLYGARLRRLEAQLSDVPQKAPGPERAVAAIEHALFHRRPRLRYAAGGDARIVTAALRVMPDRAVAALLGRTGP